MRTESDNELVNRNESRYRDGTKSLDLRSTGKDEETRSLDGDFEELEAELEWSDNDVKDDTSLSNVSLSSSGRNENEASAGGHSLTYMTENHRAAIRTTFADCQADFRGSESIVTIMWSIRKQMHSWCHFSDMPVSAISELSTANGVLCFV